jgi:membrane-bound lytic murein transglycosylase B
MMRTLLALAALTLSAPALADYSRDPKAAELLQTLTQRYGFSDAELAQVRGALADAQQIPALIEAEQKAAEKTETWTTYARKRVDPLRIQRGTQFVREQQRWFDAAESEFGVPAPVIAGVLGLETNYGRFTGKARVLDALATQGFEHPSRSPFFFGELTDFFVLCRDFGFSPTALKGSYAGAMGWTQFMPSNYRRLAVDFDGDGHKDLWTPADAVGSIARYLVAYDPQRRWRRGEPLAVPARIRGKLAAAAKVNLKSTTYTAGQLSALGIEPTVALPPETPVGIVELTLDEGKEYWVGLHNFYSVMSYNPRVYYAMTVAQLARGISVQLAEPTLP